MPSYLSLDICLYFSQIGASVFASNVGAPMFVGLSGTAAAGVIAVTTFEWHVSYYQFYVSNGYTLAIR